MFVSDVKLTNWHGANGNASLHIGSGGEQLNGSSTHLTSIGVTGGNGASFDDSFDEPWEWTAKMNNLTQNSLLYGGFKNSKCTPLMTPKKTINGHDEATTGKPDETESAANPAVDENGTDRRCVEEKVGISKALGDEAKNNASELVFADETKDNVNANVTEVKEVVLDSVFGWSREHDVKNAKCSDSAVDDGVSAGSNKIQCNLLTRISPVDRPNKLGSGGSLIVSTIVGGVEGYDCYTTSPSGVMSQKLVINPSTLLSPGSSSVVSPGELPPSISSPLLTSPVWLPPTEASSPGRNSKINLQNQQKEGRRDVVSTTEVLPPTSSVESSSVGVSSACKKCDHGKSSSTRKQKSSGKISSATIGRFMGKTLF